MLKHGDDEFPVFAKLSLTDIKSDDIISIFERMKGKQGVDSTLTAFKNLHKTPNFDTEAVLSNGENTRTLIDLDPKDSS